MTLGEWIFTAIVIATCFIPTFVAYSRCHNNRMPIFLFTFFFGWSGIGWVIALIWSFTNNIDHEALKAKRERNGRPADASFKRAKDREKAAMERFNNSDGY